MPLIQKQKREVKRPGKRRMFLVAPYALTLLAGVWKISRGGRVGSPKTAHFRALPMDTSGLIGTDQLGFSLPPLLCCRFCFRVFSSIALPGHCPDGRITVLALPRKP